MCRSASLPDPSSGGCRAPGPSFATGRVAIAVFAALASLAAAACGGEQAFSPRDASGVAGGGGTTGAGGRGGGTAGTGSAGSVGTGGGAGTEGGSSGGDAGSSAGAGSGGSAGSAGGGTAGSAGARGGSGGGGGKGMGMPCTKGSDCASTFCFDTVCCAADCTGTCRTCNGASPGNCVFVPDGMDPRDQCPDETSTTMCGRTGACNGSGTCRYAGSSVVCATTPSCDSANASIVSTKVCNGAGACVPGMTQSCNGYLCTAGPPPACGTTCTNDAACVVGGFCSGATCIASANLVGNGDLETGTTNGWIAANGGGTVGLSAVAASGVAHAGGYSVYVTNRAYNYQGPGYNIPTGPGKYTITGWALQRDLPSVLGVLQVRLACRLNVNPGFYVDVTPDGSFGKTMLQNVWTQFSATIDTSTQPAECQPTAATPGLIRLATLYLNHDTATIAPYPDLYLDDVVVSVPDGHNLVGNPNFEAGLTDGWSLSTGSSTLSISDTVAHTGTRSLKQSGRSVPAAGPRYALTAGTARYAFSFWVKHGGTATRDLILQPSYNCINPSTQVLPPPIKVAAGVAGDTWTELTGTFTFPPADATAGCKLQSAAIYVRTDGNACGTGAGQVECPDLYLDDVSIKLAP